MHKLAKDTDLSEGVHVIKFFATWCGPCKLYAPAFERVAAQFPEANFYAVDVDEQEEMRAEYEVDSVPTTVIVRAGERVEEVAGAKSTRQLAKFVKRVLSSSYDHST